jgi:hypothetical protein
MAVPVPPPKSGVKVSREVGVEKRMIERVGMEEMEAAPVLVPRPPPVDEEGRVVKDTVVQEVGVPPPKEAEGMEEAEPTPPPRGVGLSA